MNQDGVIDGRDTQIFIDTIRNPGGQTAQERCRADIGSSGSACTPDDSVNMSDVPGFVSLLLEGACS